MKTSNIRQVPPIFNTQCASYIKLPKLVPIKEREKMHKSTLELSIDKFDISATSTNSLNFTKSKDLIYLKKSFF